MNIGQPAPDIPKLIEMARESRKRRTWVQISITLGILAILAFYLLQYYNKINNFQAQQLKPFPNSELGKQVQEMGQRQRDDLKEALREIGRNVGPVYYTEIQKQMPEFQPRVETEMRAQFEILQENTQERLAKHRDELQMMIDEKEIKLRTEIPELDDSEKTQEAMQRLQIAMKAELVLAMQEEFDGHIKLLDEIQNRIERIGKTAPPEVQSENDLVLIGLGLELLGAGIREPLQEK